ncbi:5'/3'-nucleotidase SurE [Marinomonas agarivorans]|nr:5'/3'-nucleotidase SurE [Marinomonas agarivorans]
MRILIANDDGLEAKGIQVLAQSLSSLYDVVVVAPDRNRSGASNSLTLTRPLQPRCIRQGQYSVDGTPTDCVNLALSGVIDGQFDLVISGINHGPNLGDDVLYSGTVAAAMEARHLGLPAFAVSLVGENYFTTAAQVVLHLLKKPDELLAATKNISANAILNINVPDLPYEDIKGVVVTRLGHRHSAQPAIPAQHPRGIESFWIGAVSEPHDDAAGTDFHAIQEGFATVTPLHADMTCYNALNPLNQWLNQVIEPES